MIAVSDVQSHCDRILDAVEQAVVGKREALELVLLGMLADGHVLIEDFPGLAKTLLARSFAAVTDLRFSRIQFTPDLMPSDVTGSSIYNQRTAEFDFRPGPVFANLLLGDEINRAPPKTQAALLEAMQERQVTLEGETRQLERPFLVLATQNPIEYEGTYPLPEAQLDRFLLRIGVGYPAREHEWEMLERRRERRVDEVELTPVIDRETVLELQRAIEEVHVAESIGLYMVDVVAATRASPRVQVGASPRGSLALLKLSRGLAALRGRDFVTPEDVKNVAVPALAHRLTLNPELWVQRIRAEDVVQECLDAVPTPQGRGRRSHRRDAAPRQRSSRATRRSALSGSLPASRSAAPSSSCSPRRSCSCSRSGSSPAAAPELDGRRSRRPRRACSRATRSPSTIGLLCCEPRSSGSSSALAVPRDVRSEGDTSFGLSLAAGEHAELHGHAALPALGRLPARPRGPRGLRPARPVRLRAGAAGGSSRARVSAGGAAPRDRSAARDAGVRRKPRRAGRRARGSSSQISGSTSPATACGE